jgi:oligopeptide transport system permease protein
MAILKHPRVERLEAHIGQTLAGTLTEAEKFTFAPFNQEETERTGVSQYSYWRSTFHAFSKNRVAMFLLLAVVIILLFTFIQPILPGQFDSFAVNNNPATGLPYKNEPPNGTFIMGTNAIGQDLWSRLWSGTRTSLFIGISVAVIEALVGIIMGLLWGYLRKLDFLFTEIYNIIDNIPTTIILILMSMIFRPGISTIILALS